MLEEATEEEAGEEARVLATAQRRLGAKAAAERKLGALAGRLAAGRRTAGRLAAGRRTAGRGGPVGHGLKEGGEVIWLGGRSCLLVWKLQIGP